MTSSSGSSRVRRGATGRTVAFAGGRGGIGRSLLAANIGVYLAQVGKRVVLVDADLGGASQHTILGIDRPETSLAQVIDRQAEHLSELIIDTTVPGLRLLSGAGDRFGVANLRPTQKERLLQQLKRIDADYVLLDVGGGTTFNVLDLFLVADFGVLVAVPEPSSVEATYRFIKSAVIRLVRRDVGRQTQWPQVLDETATRLGGLPSPVELHEALEGPAAPLADLVEEALSRLDARLIINRVETRKDLELGRDMKSIAEERLGVALDYLGHVEDDDAVGFAARKRGPLMIESPGARAAEDIERIARRILAPLGAERPRAVGAILPKPLSERSHYDVLELDVGASDDDIRRGYKRMREMFSPDSLVGYSLVDEDASVVRTERIQLAYDTLIDAKTRREYDISTPRAPAPRPRPTPVTAQEPDTEPGSLDLTEYPEPTSTEGSESSKPPPPPTPTPTPAPELEITPETRFDGPLLRQVRESRGIELSDITARTKIGTPYLVAIEEEDFDSLPALVYTRGFVGEVAKFLGLDPKQVVESYIPKLKKYLQES